MTALPLDRLPAASAVRLPPSGGPLLPAAFVAGYFAGRMRSGSAGNSYAQGLPTDHEAHADLWEAGYQLARLADSADCCSRPME
jgi:hypothetical protein